MAVQKRTTPAGSVRWVARWRDPAGKEHSKSFTTRRAARDHCADMERRKHGGQYPHEQDITVAELFTRWMNHRPLRPRTRDSYEFTLKRQIQPLADWPARKVTTADIAEWVAQLQNGRPWISPGDKGLKDSTIQTTLRQLRSAFAWGIREELVAKNPVQSPRRTTNIEPDEIPTLDEIQAVIRCVRKGGAPYQVKKSPRSGYEVVHHRKAPAVADMMTTALLTGMRVSELSGLIVREVDLDAGIIKVRKQYGKRAPRGRVELKTASSRRDIPIAGELRPVLQARIAGKPGDEYVFSKDSGRAISNETIARIVKHAAEFVGARRVHFHALRHFFASSLITAGVPIQDVAKVLGHKSPATTLQVYTHVIEGSRDRISDAISATVGRGIDAGSRGLRVVS